MGNRVVIDLENGRNACAHIRKSEVVADNGIEHGSTRSVFIAIAGPEITAIPPHGRHGNLRDVCNQENLSTGLMMCDQVGNGCCLQTHGQALMPKNTC